MLHLDPSTMPLNDVTSPHRASEDPQWSALAKYLQTAADAGEVVTLTSRPAMLTPTQVAERLGMSRATVQRRIQSGALRTVKVGSHHRVPIKEFQRFRDELYGDMIELVSADLESELYG